MLKVREGDQKGDWKITGTVLGERVRKSVRGVDRVQAEAMRVAMELAMLRNEGVGVTWAQACDGYVRNRRPGDSTERRLCQLRRVFGATDVGRFDLKKVRDWCVARGHGDGTVRLMVGNAKTVLLWGEKAGLYDLKRRPACELPEEPEARDRFLESEAEVEALRACADDWFRPLVTFLFYTGARVGEARQLVWGDVDLKAGVVRLRTRKGRRGKERVRSVPLNDKVRAELAGLAVGARQGPVFTAERGGKLFAQGVYDPWRRMCERAGVEDFNPHDARRTFATLLLRKNVAPFQIRALLGHDSEGMLKRYAYLAPTQLAGVVAMLD